MSSGRRIDVPADLAARLRRSAAATSVADARAWLPETGGWRLWFRRLQREWRVVKRRTAALICA